MDRELSGLDPEELEYTIAEREGTRIDSLVCPECPDPALCMAEGECPKGEVPPWS